MSADEALERLLAGNERFMAGGESEAARSAARRAELSGGQRPIAVVLGCSDSRVPPETIFDQGLGDIFTVRVAGNTVAAPSVLGSIEFAVAQLGTTLVVVLGHEQCGAVKGAVASATAGAEVPGSIGDVIEPIVPVVERVRGSGQDLSDDELLARSIPANVENTIAELERASPLLAEGIESGEVKVVGAEYRLESGEVRLL